MSQPSLEGQLFAADYRRSHDVHSFVTHEGSLVTAVSAPDWDSFSDMLENLPPTQGYIVSPELITCTDMPMAALADMHDIVAERTEHVRTISHAHPQAVIALGNVACTTQGFMNQLEIIRGGTTVAAIHKTAFTDDELEVFAPGSHDGERWTHHPTVQLALCHELIRVALNRGAPNDKLLEKYRTNALNEQAVSLLVSSCFAVPMSSRAESVYSQYAKPDEERYRGQLETAVGYVFAAYPNLQDIIMTDRRPSQGTIEPLNVHFRRLAAAEE